MQLQTFKGGYDRNFAYLLWNELSHEACAIDPIVPEAILAFLEKHSLSLKAILNTHSHFDHVSGNELLLSKTGAKLLHMKEKQKQNICGMILEAIETPGHADDVCFLVESKMVFTGDTLFVGKIGGTGSVDAAKLQWLSLKKLLLLPDAVIVYPGHDYGEQPSSTIGQERKNNPFLLRLSSFEDFLWLKEHWAEYKLKHHLL